MNKLKFSKFVLLFICAISIFSCKDDDDVEFTDPNYNVLGISEIRINDALYNINDSTLLLDISSSDNITLSGCGYTKSTLHETLSYSIITTFKSISTEIISCYPDVSIVTSSGKDDDRHSHITIIVSREGYDEQVTYTFNFITVSQ